MGAEASRRTILVATTNAGKVRELRAMLGDSVGWKTLADFPGVGEVEEDGATFAENARKKATEYARATGLWTLADDSGLVVDALGGAPGVQSARFSGDAGPGADRKEIDRRNIAKLLRLLEGVPPEKRTARFVCHLCLASPERVLVETQGTVEGLIVDEPVGDNGFGYDPVFFVGTLGRTVAQLPDDEKNAISHRGNAIRRFMPLLNEVLAGSVSQDGR
ncbi:XTP/dITP diphosphatase [Anaerobaca lacustris]|uniref:dITP/XTP pyrophosphatase n=1 Tax=Anaerobaca lacustris TaxID=3044600 RepID=A0AAW6TZK6_9BACT|nr:XTP/dITP diphosphatase [Sedimentisphaerales bacterium M17dextr]